MSQAESQAESRIVRALIPALAVVFLAALDLTVVAPILPQVIVDLNIGTADADRYAWIVLSYLVAYTVTVPLAGKLSDRYGRLTIFLAALALFMVGSALSAAASTLPELVAGRTVQGLGGGAMLPVSMALVADVIPGRRRVAALGIVAAVDTFGWVLGPLWGSFVSEVFGTWRAIFWLNLPFGVLAGAVLLALRPAAVNRSRDRGTNTSSILVGAVGLTLVCLAISTGSEGGVGTEGQRVLGGTPHPLAAYRMPALIAGIIALGAFALIERRSSDPVIPRPLIGQRGFQLAAVANVLAGAALIVALVNAPLTVALLSSIDQQSRNSSILLGGFALLMTLGAILGGRLTRMAGIAPAAGLGLVVAAAGFGWMTVWPNDLQLDLMTTSIGVAGLGLGIAIAPIADAAIGRARSVDYGVASGMVLLARLLGMTFGLAGITRYGVERLDARISELPRLEPREDESTADFFARQQEYVEDEAIPITLDVIRETYLAGALVCLLAVLVVVGIHYSRDEPNTS